MIHCETLQCPLTHIFTFIYTYTYIYSYIRQYPVSSFSSLGSRQSPTSSPGRVVYVCIWAVVIILFAIYSGNLTAFLSKPRVTKPPATIRELVLRDWTISLDKAYGAHDIVKVCLFSLSLTLLAFHGCLS